MKQIIQDLQTGAVELLDVPCPGVKPNNVLLGTRASLISAGTERMLHSFAQANLLNKARQQPQRVNEVFDKIRSDGLLSTIDAVRNKLSQPIPLGYCAAGEVLEVGAGCEGIEVGDHIVCNTPHVELTLAPVNLTAKIPDGVSYEQAAFTPLAAIAMQGIRLIEPQVGEVVVVYGLGLVGLLAVQILSATGVQVLGVDLDRSRLDLARSFGVDAVHADDIASAANAASKGRGVDGVLITASASDDSIAKQSANMCRKRGRIVLVGTVDLNLDRADFYEKELRFQVSCSYGPGRYDDSYEQRGNDYPFAYVRWTEQRNFEAVLNLMGRGLLEVERLITHRVPFSEAATAYRTLTEDRSSLGIVFQYEDSPSRSRTVQKSEDSTPASTLSAAQVNVALVGAGNFGVSVLLKELSRTSAHVNCVVSANGLSAARAARKFGVPRTTTDTMSLLDDDSVNTVFIATRPNLHAEMVCDFLRAGKHVFVEKPLALTQEELTNVREQFAQVSGQQLMVGFNRRFSPHAVKMSELLMGRSDPICADILVNAGHLPASHWAHDPQVGGGRIISEGCHWIDLLRFLVGCPVVRVQATTARRGPSGERLSDHASMMLEFEDGSIGTLHYLANGHHAFPKERMTVFCGGQVLELDNFRKLTGRGWPSFRRNRLLRQDKGHRSEVNQFVDRIATGGQPLISPEELWNVSAAAIAAHTAAMTGLAVNLD